MQTQPIISCICITRARIHLLSKAIQCFLYQTYQEKELIILFEDDDAETLSFSSDSLYAQHPAIKWIKAVRLAHQHLGTLRNTAISHASGSFICQWDDDDWYHPERLSYQLSELQQSGKDACVLAYEMIFDSVTQLSYLSCLRFWEGTILCNKSIALQYPYVNLQRGEDTPFITALQQQSNIHLCNTITPFYIYIYHGNNTWDYNHFSGFFPYCKLLPTSIHEAVSNILLHTDHKAIILLDQLFKEHFNFENAAAYSSNNSFTG